MVGGGSSAGATGGAGAPSSAYRGRGGAGNYALGVAEEEDRRARGRVGEEEKRELLRGQIEKGVEEGLARPERARLSGGEAF